MAKNEIKKMAKRCNVHFHSRRHRLADPDGISGKAVLDGIVNSGLLANDSAKEIKHVTHSQEKIPGAAQEETVIIITEEET